MILKGIYPIFRISISQISNFPGSDYDALVEILYGATCNGTDKNYIYGRHLREVKYPMLLGHESVGRVVDIGKRVKNFCIGNLITDVGCPPTADGKISSKTGGFAEYGIVKDVFEMKKAGIPREMRDKYRANRVLPSWFSPAASTIVTPYRENIIISSAYRC